MEEQDLLAVTIGKNITRLRKRANMTQLELAEKLNYSDKSVSKWEQGNGIPDLRILVQLSEIYGVSLDDLVKEHHEKPVVPKKEKINHRLIVFFSSSGLCWLVAVIAFVLISIFAPEFGAAWGWMSFVYAVPVNAIVVLVFACVWHYKVLRILSMSVLVWTLIAAVYLTALPYNPWQLFLIGIPLQILALFFFVWRKGAHFKD